MLINLRNAMMAGKRLPYDAEVEFLKSTGAQYILTGVPGGAARWEIGARANSTTTQVLVSMNRGANGGYYFGVLSGVWGFGGSGNNTTIAGTTYADINATIVGTGTSMATVNGQSCSRTQPNTVQTDEWMLFASSPTSFPFYGQIYYARCYQNGVLVRDFIPVRKGTVGYLYDRVTGKLFGNAGSGDFVLGPDVVPVEYIESHGTEWIDTGVVPTTADSFYCRVKQSVIKDQAFWGVAGVAYCFSNWHGGGGDNGTYWGHPAIGTGGVNGVNPLGDTNWHEILCQPSGIFVDGVKINTQVTGSTQSPLNTVALFARAVNSAGGGVAKNGQGRMSAFRIERNGDPLRKYLPVRVGTEGAMMDVLTRRIYRNAGTGAFGYGDDLKYPIPA